MCIVLYSTVYIVDNTYRYIFIRCCTEVHKTQRMKFPLKQICAHTAKEYLLHGKLERYLRKPKGLLLYNLEKHHRKVFRSHL